MASRFGLECLPDRRKRSLLRSVHDFFQNFLVFGLQWAFNPGGLRGKDFIRSRDPLYMTRKTLLDRYGEGAEVASPAQAVTAATG
jgi:hypothetical protein